MILQGDARQIPLPDGSVHCVVTSPPYWGLRDYGLAPSVWGGEPGCEHRWGIELGKDCGRRDSDDGQPSRSFHGGHSTPGARGSNSEKAKTGKLCQLCGAWRGSLGLEPTPEFYVAHIVEVFCEVRRVLRDDGTLWLNLGDSYAGGATGGFRPGAGRADGIVDDRNQRNRNGNTCPPGLKPKDLCMIPARVALALQADGWWLRSDIIWSKPNPMPESVQDRPTTAHEHVFLLAKQERYFYDALAIAEPSITNDLRRPYGSQGAWELDGRPEEQRHGGQPRKPDKQRGHSRRHAGFNDRWDAMEKAEQCSGTRNASSVWEIATQPFPEAHFATFPEELARRCIAAGTSERGCCPQCGAGWERITEPTGHVNRREAAHAVNNTPTKIDSTGWAPLTQPTNRWQPTCSCSPADPIPALVLDPFAGSGTVGEVAFRMGRRAVCLDLKWEYCRMAMRRIPPMAFLAGAVAQ